MITYQLLSLAAKEPVKGYDPEIRKLAKAKGFKETNSWKHSRTSGPFEAKMDKYWGNSHHEGVVKKIKDAGYDLVGKDHGEGKTGAIVRHFNNGKHHIELHHSSKPHEHLKIVHYPAP